MATADKWHKCEVFSTIVINQDLLHTWIIWQLVLGRTESSHFANFCASPNCTNSTFLKCLNRISATSSQNFGVYQWEMDILQIQRLRVITFFSFFFSDNDADENAKMMPARRKRWISRSFRCLFSQPRLGPAAGINNYRKKAFHWMRGRWKWMICRFWWWR